MSTLKELLQKATPGIWMVGESFPARVFFDRKKPMVAECHVSDWDAQNPTISKETAHANAQLIARCSPQTMALVLEALEAADKALAGAHDVIEVDECGPDADMARAAGHANAVIRSTLAKVRPALESLNNPTP